MSESKNKRTKKKQMGQFMTPLELSKDLIKNRKYKKTDKILEPSFGEGSFLIAIIDKLLDVYPNELTTQQKIDLILQNNLFGVEMDTELYDKAFHNIKNRYGCIIKDHNLINNDFFKIEFDTKFDYCEGNPPFGGTFETNFGEKLDKLYGKRNEEKIKKETYSFFTVRCIELLKENGYLGFVCSDTFLSINTMKGLRKYVSNHTMKIQRISFFSDETNYGMVYFDVKINNKPQLKIDGKEIKDRKSVV
jgi:type I restriction-modification system DNA methylase subunit